MSKKKPETDDLSEGRDKKKTLFHKDLSGFDIKVNAFGELESSFNVDKINTFLNREVEDKKLKDRPDLKDHWKEEEE